MVAFTTRWAALGLDDQERTSMMSVPGRMVTSTPPTRRSIAISRVMGKRTALGTSGFDITENWTVPKSLFSAGELCLDAIAVERDENRVALRLRTHGDTVERVDVEFRRTGNESQTE